MSETLVGVETFSVAKTKSDDDTGFCSLIFGKRLATLRDGKSCVPSGEPFSSLFLRLSQNETENAIAIKQRVKREGRKLNPAQDEQMDESVSQAVSSLELPKLGMETLENQIATLYALDQDVKDFTLLVHAIQVLATMEAMADAPLKHRYVCATEFKTPVKRTMDESKQSPPMLEMQLWNAKAAANILNEKLIQPLGKAWQPYQVKYKISVAQQRLEQAKKSGDDETAKQLEAKLSEYEKRLAAYGSVLERPSNIFERLLSDLDFKSVQVMFSSAKGSRYTPSGDLILSTDSAKSPTPYQSQRIALVFQDWKPYQLYLNELETGTGRFHLKKTAVHHIEYLRTEDTKDVLRVFAEYLCFDLSDSRRQLLVEQVDKYLKMNPEDREDFGMPLGEAEKKLLAMFQKYNSANTITPYAAFASQSNWDQEFKV